MTFDDFYKKRRKENPDENKYITLCHILVYSGEEKNEIEKIFHKYLKLGVDYDKKEAVEMIDYLVQIAHDIEDY